MRGKNKKNLKFNEIASSATKGSKQIIELSQHTNHFVNESFNFV